MQTAISAVVLSAPTTPRPQPDDLLTSAGLKVTLGNISEMTIWRWGRDRGFPKPDLIIARRKFWRRGTVQAWLDAQAEGSAADTTA